VIAIIPTADRGKATVKVRVGLDVRDPRIVPDMGVRVSFLEKVPPRQAQRQAGVLAPAAAIVQRDGKDTVFVVADNGTAQARPVTLGRTLGDDREVLSGLSGGDTVVVEPPEKLVDGARVRVAMEAAGESSDNP
jgi:multidrug efflux pump subunit AcrA (membrane-fusion protein)